MSRLGRVLELVFGRRPATRVRPERLARIEAAAIDAQREAQRVLEETERIRRATRGAVNAIQRPTR